MKRHIRNCWKKFCFLRLFMPYRSHNRLNKFFLFYIDDKLSLSVSQPVIKNSIKKDNKTLNVFTFNFYTMGFRYYNFSFDTF